MHRRNASGIELDCNWHVHHNCFYYFGDYLASRRKTHSKEDFYTAGGSISAKQNGLAIAGDYMSASTLLGASSMVFLKVMMVLFMSQAFLFVGQS